MKSVKTMIIKSKMSETRIIKSNTIKRIISLVLAVVLMVPVQLMNVSVVDANTISQAEAEDKYWIISELIDKGGEFGENQYRMARWIDTVINNMSEIDGYTSTSFLLDFCETIKPRYNKSGTAINSSVVTRHRNIITGMLMGLQDITYLESEHGEIPNLMIRDLYDAYADGHSSDFESGDCVTFRCAVSDLEVLCDYEKRTTRIRYERENIRCLKSLYEAILRRPEQPNSWNFTAIYGFLRYFAFGPERLEFMENIEEEWYYDFLNHVENGFYVWEVPVNEDTYFWIAKAIHSSHRFKLDYLGSRLREDYINWVLNGNSDSSGLQWDTVYLFAQNEMIPEDAIIYCNLINEGQELLYGDTTSDEAHDWINDVKHAIDAIDNYSDSDYPLYNVVNKLWTRAAIYEDDVNKDNAINVICGILLSWCAKLSGYEPIGIDVLYDSGENMLEDNNFGAKAYYWIAEVIKSLNNSDTEYPEAITDKFVGMCENWCLGNIDASDANIKRRLLGYVNGLVEYENHGEISLAEIIADYLVQDGENITNGHNSYDSSFAKDWIDNLNYYLQNTDNTDCYDYFSKAYESYSEKNKVDDSIIKVVSMLRVYILEDIYIEGNIGSYLRNEYENNTMSRDDYYRCVYLYRMRRQLEMHESQYDYYVVYYELLNSIDLALADAEYSLQLSDTYSLDDFEDDEKNEEKMLLSSSLRYYDSMFWENDTLKEKFCHGFGIKAKEVLQENSDKIPFDEYIIDKCEELINSNGNISYSDMPYRYTVCKVGAMLRHLIGEEDEYGPNDAKEIYQIIEFVRDRKANLFDNSELQDTIIKDEWYSALIKAYLFCHSLGETYEITRLMALIRAEFERDDYSNMEEASNIDRISELFCQVAYCNGVSVKVDGYQISTSYGGHRVIYSVNDQNNKVIEAGLIYGLADSTSVDDMNMETENNNVYSFKATERGKINSVNNTATNQVYAMTMKFIENVNYFKAPIRVRAYAKVESGQYAYSDVFAVSVFDIASVLYDYSMMNSKEGHEYLYNNILNKCQPGYKLVEY